MILPIYLEPQPILTQPTKLIEPNEIKSEKLQQLLEDMTETMANAEGIGLAGPQVGLGKRLTVIDNRAVNKSRKDYIYLINPKIIRKSFKKVVMEEGCLSIPGVYGTVKRPETITVEYLDKNGDKQKIKTSGLLARIVQHEVDHLDGVLFTSKILEYTLNKRETPEYPSVA